MIGRREIQRNRQRLDATFERIKRIHADAELQSDFAKYLCILVSGFVETRVKELILEHTRQKSGPSVQRFVESRMRRGTNFKSERLSKLLGSFNPEWERNIATVLVDEKKDALNSVVSLRNGIAHGQSVGITFQSISTYYKQIILIIDAVADLCDPR